MQYVFPLKYTKLTERLEWKTDIHEAVAGAEDATKVRDVPRQVYSIEAFASADDKARVFNLLYSGLTSQWGVPVWSEETYIGSISSGSRIDFDTTFKDYRSGSLAIIYTSPGSFQVVTVSELTDTYITTSEAFSAAKNVFIAPLRIGHIKGRSSRSFNQRDEIISISFEMDDARLLSPSAPDTLLGYDLNLYGDGLLEGDRASGEFQTRDDSVDFELGAVQRVYQWNHSKVVYPYNVVLEDTQEIWDFRNWLYRRAGRYRKFWMPTWEQDLRLISSSDNQIYVYGDDFTTTESIRRQLAIETASGWITRAIVEIGELINGEVWLTLDSAVSSPIIRVCWLGLRRLNTDSIDISYLGGGVAKVALSVIEVAPNGDPDAVLQTEAGLSFATETGQPVAVETATQEQQAASASKKISELDAATVEDAADAGAYIVVAVSDKANYKIHIADLLPEQSETATILVGTVGATSFAVANPFLTDDVFCTIYDTVTNAEIGLALVVTDASISASGLSPIEVTNQFKIMVRK